MGVGLVGNAPRIATPKPKAGVIGGPGYGGGGGGQSISLPGFSGGGGSGGQNVYERNAGGGGGAGGGAGGGPNLNNFAQKDPRIESAANKLDQRYSQLQGMEGQQDPFLMESVQNLRDRMSSDTTARAIDRASSGAADYAAGMQERGAQAGARMGRGGDFGSSAIGSAAQRLQARQAADISLGRERDLDALALGGHNILASPSGYNLAQRGQTNEMLGGVAGFAGAGAQLGLNQQRLGLDQWQAGSDANYKQALLNQQGGQNSIDNYLKLLQASGY